MAKGYGLAEDRLDEAIKPSDPASMYGGRDQIKLGKYLKKLGAKGAYFDGSDFVGSMTKQYSSKTTLAGALNPKNDYTVQDLIDALKSQKEDVTIQLPTESSLSEKKATIDLDLADGDMKKIEKKYKVKFKKRKDGGFDVSGDTKNLHKLLKGDEYAFDQEDIEDMFPEVLEAKAVTFTEGTLKVNGYAGSDAGGDNPKKFGIKVKKVGSSMFGDNVEMSGPDAKLIKFAIANLGVDKKAKTLADVQKQVSDMMEVKEEEQSDKQKKYKAFFAKALKKFGAKSPAELEGDKKKEFFDYVDANYEADNESD